MESRFGIVQGVVRTRVGYAGGTTEAPTYRHMGDHTETVQIDYDPRRISFEQLLEIFWESHDPTSRPYSVQYKNAVFFHSPEQEQAAAASKAALEKKLGQEVATQIVPLKSFTMAEDYHQKYMLKHHQIKNEIMAIYPDHHDFVDSTAAARLNGYAGQYGTREQMEEELDLLGLSQAGKEKLKEMLRGGFQMYP